MSTDDRALLVSGHPDAASESGESARMAVPTSPYLPIPSPSPSLPSSPSSPSTPRATHYSSSIPSRNSSSLPLLLPSSVTAAETVVPGDAVEGSPCGTMFDDPAVHPDSAKSKPSSRRSLRFAFVGAGIILLIALIVGIILLLRGRPNKRNVILMISDGFGPASETFSRSYFQMVNKLPPDYQMPLDTILVGQSRTRSASSLVTDSAAGATAFSCTKKTYNEAVAVDENKVSCGTVLEAAKAKGMFTGLVATSRITHATPAAFSSHVVHRDMENEIARQQIGDYVLGRQVDLMFGGGRCHFMPRSVNGSCRADDQDVLKEAQDAGWTVIQTRKMFDELDPEKSRLPLAGLFTLDHMAFEIDRDPSKEPSLKEMSMAALSLLHAATESSDKGFFIMIEGSKIDLAAHSNDAGAHVHDILQYQETITYVKSWVDRHPGTVMISVSDHETGGLTLARQISSEYPEYLWFPEVIQRVKNSTEVLASKILKYRPTASRPDFTLFLKETIFHDGLGITDASEDEFNLFRTSDDMELLDYSLANMTNFRAQLGWTTHGHSGVDVNLYAHGEGSELLRGSHENTDIGEFIRSYLDLDLEAITRRLKTPSLMRRSEVDMPLIFEETMRDGLKHYHHAHGITADL